MIVREGKDSFRSFL